MNPLQPRSLQLRLAVRLGLLFLVATVLAVGLIAYLGERTADSLSRRDLLRLADELAETIGRNGAVGSPARLIERGLLDDATRYAIRDSRGRVIAASDEAMRGIAEARRRPARRRSRSFLLESVGPEGAHYYALDTRQRSAIGPVSVLVAEPDGADDQLLNAMLHELIVQAAWILPLFISATLLVGVFAIRSGLRPLRETADQAASIKPDAISLRLGSAGLPSEVFPLVKAVNQALDRLEEGFALQRQFTANAAHELRTPLAIITGALEELDADGKVARLRQDVARMNRLVEQLLHVARLDSVDLDVNEDVDLNECAREVVEYMAPRAIEQNRSVALMSAERPVHIKGNRHALEDALLNLVENAIIHTAPGTEVRVKVSSQACISVCDRGPGVPPEDRSNIFDRFWRGPGSSSGGAGLGLAIVREIMLSHKGEIQVTAAPGGGACFTLKFAGAK